MSSLRGRFWSEIVAEGELSVSIWGESDSYVMEATDSSEEDEE